MKIDFKTHIGLIRDSNQDACDAGFFPSGDAWMVVCDGMGGVSGGQIASTLCIEKTVEAIKRGYRKGMTVNNVKNLLNSAISAANSIVYERSNDDFELKGMGTTIVAAIIIDSIAVIAHVGDSRAYIINDSITSVTKDHSLVQLLLDTGKITPAMAKVHPERNVITRAIGAVNFVDVEIDIVDLAQDDILLLCTDGLNGYVEDEDILKIVKENGFECADKLIEAANNAGGHDNVTVALAVNSEKGA